MIKLERASFRTVIARTDRRCNNCDAPWSKGDSICLMADRETDRFELICLKCEKDLKTPLLEPKASALEEVIVRLESILIDLKNLKGGEYEEIRPGK